MNKVFIYFFLVLLSSFSSVDVTAQSTSHKEKKQIDTLLQKPTPLICGFDQIMTSQRKSNDFMMQEIKMNSDILEKKSNSIDEIITLPVVFHIVQPNPETFSNAAINNVIQDLNNAFSKSGNYSSSTGVDTKIRFCLAQKAPDGGITNGINRISSSYGINLNADIEDRRLKNLAQWDPNKYINIWVVRNMYSEVYAEFSCDTWTRGNMSGYATMPPGGSSRDGIVVSQFGTLLVHEMGHYLGLYHTFNGGCINNDCEKDGDKVCDTPPDQTYLSSLGCIDPKGMNSCLTDTLSNFSNGYFPKDVPDLGLNFMDYGNASCANEFTYGQAIRMRAAINTQRPGLLENKCQPPCPENILAKFSRNLPVPKPGELITFTNSSVGASRYEWLIDNVVVSTGLNFTTSFPGNGKYLVTLKAYNGSSCFSSYRDEVIITCGVIARFYNVKRKIASKADILLDSILFVNQSVNATSFKWLMKLSSDEPEVEISNATNLNHVFLIPGNPSLRLVASNGTCSDTTDQYYIPVLDPTSDAIVSISRINCFQETKVRVQFTLCNSGFKPLPAKTPVSFYTAHPSRFDAKKIDTTFLTPSPTKGYCCGQEYTVILNVGYRHLDSLYAVVGDTGIAIPFNLPNTITKEKSYNNNATIAKNIRFRTTISPLNINLLPEDTLLLTATTFPDPTSTSFFTWSDAKRISCINCAYTFFYADSTHTKRLVARSQYGCYDTAFVTLKVPPVNDYTIKIQNISCASRDSILVQFDITNHFQSKKAILPKNLFVSFYLGDPETDTAKIISPHFFLQNEIRKPFQSFSIKIKNMGSGLIFASVNDNGNSNKISAQNRILSETDFSNNLDKYFYDQPVTTVNVNICFDQTYFGYSKTGIYIDTFKISTLCDSIRVLHLTVHPKKVASRNLAICKGDSILLGGKMQKERGLYIDTLVSSAGCDSILFTNLFYADLPEKFLPPDTTICEKGSLTIHLPQYKNFLWSDGSIENPHTLSEPGTYSLEVRDRNGCYGKDTITISKTYCIDISIPNAFSPNGDGKNDVFRPLVPVSLKGFKMQIWNRWGVLLFETNTPSKGWNGYVNGMAQPAGTYVYNITYKNHEGVVEHKKGTLVLIR